MECLCVSHPIVSTKVSFLRFLLSLQKYGEDDIKIAKINNMPRPRFYFFPRQRHIRIIIQLCDAKRNVMIKVFAENNFDWN